MRPALLMPPWRARLRTVGEGGLVLLLVLEAWAVLVVFWPR